MTATLLEILDKIEHISTEKGIFEVKELIDLFPDETIERLIEVLIQLQMDKKIHFKVGIDKGIHMEKMKGYVMKSSVVSGIMDRFKMLGGTDDMFDVLFNSGQGEDPFGWRELNIMEGIACLVDASFLTATYARCEHEDKSIELVPGLRRDDKNNLVLECYVYADVKQNEQDELTYEPYMKFTATTIRMGDDQANADPLRFFVRADAKLADPHNHRAQFSLRSVEVPEPEKGTAH